MVKLGNSLLLSLSLFHFAFQFLPQELLRMAGQVLGAAMMPRSAAPQRAILILRAPMNHGLLVIGNHPFFVGLE